MTGLNFMVNVAKDTLLGYIRVIAIGAANTATEKLMDSMTAAEVATITQKELKTYYKIGDYWYIVI